MELLTPRAFEYLEEILEESGSDAPKVVEVRVAPAPTLAIHYIGITFLYFCQGLAQTSTGVVTFVLIHHNTNFPPHIIGLLTTPIYAFSFKFLWAPIVDMIYVARTRSIESKSVGVLSVVHRRFQWTVLMQIVMVGGFLYFFALSEGLFNGAGTEPENVWLDVAQQRRGYGDVYAVLLLVTVASATQDIAVDAWAVEGLPESKAKNAGMLQSIGLAIGALMSTVYMSQYARDGERFSLSIYFITCAMACALGLVGGSITAFAAPLRVMTDSSQSVLRNLGRFFTTKSIQDFACVVLCLAVPIATNNYVQVEYIRLKWNSTQTASILAVIRTVSQLAFSASVLPLLLKRFTPSMILLRGAQLMFIPSAVTCLVLAFVVGHTSPSESDSTIFKFLVLVPLVLVESVLTCTLFVAVMGQIAMEASAFPHITGTAVTLCSSIANLGQTLLSNAVMLTADGWAEVLHISREWFALWATVLMVFVGAAVHLMILVPALKRLHHAP